MEHYFVCYKPEFLITVIVITKFYCNHSAAFTNKLILNCPKENWTEQLPITLLISKTTKRPNFWEEKCVFPHSLPLSLTLCPSLCQVSWGIGREHRWPIILVLDPLPVPPLLHHLPQNYLHTRSQSYKTNLLWNKTNWPCNSLIESKVF